MNVYQWFRHRDGSRPSPLTPSQPGGASVPGPIAGTATVLVVLVALAALIVLTMPATNSSVNTDRTTWWSTVWAGVSSLVEPRWLPPLLARSGWLAPVVFVAVFVPVTLLGLPRTVLTLTAGWVFGVWAGALLAWGAGVLAACVGYELARAAASRRGRAGGNLGAAGALDGLPNLPTAASSGWGGARPAGMGTGWRASGRLAALAQRMECESTSRSSLLGVLSARLVPVLPFALVNYGCGALRVPRWLFVLGSALGLLPGAWAYAVVGAGLSTQGRPQVATAMAAAVVGVVALGAAIVKRRRRKVCPAA
ncbi:hypothetical protein GCM10009740_15900 [Terrabacter terrae]|uniref:TVP38/TMEM64 family membrane protein n=1 Tax=Terrabacter terrae TaxID=318434 RepID=A0ABN2U3E7_9MICO